MKKIKDEEIIDFILNNNWLREADLEIEIGRLSKKGVIKLMVKLVKALGET